ncbi:DUF429 domain-containing protein [Candidatus Bathyarchaeota archaeon]|nr:DUF429 domain-containing protein [Candidatus Bathyarchaeota archaeon]
MSRIIIGIDLAAKQKNPTGWALLKGKKIETSIIYKDEEILEKIKNASPSIVAIDAPLKLPKTGLLRKADRELIKRGYRVFPPGLQSMRTLTIRAMRLNRLILEMGIETIEVHPTSTRRALNMPLKNLKEIKAILEELGLEGSWKAQSLKLHEIDAITAALTAQLYLKGLTESFGDEGEGYIVIPKRQDWRALKI